MVAKKHNISFISKPNDLGTYEVQDNEWVDIRPQEEQKTMANIEIDTAAEHARSRYVTYGSGQAMTYQEKGEEAADYAAAGYPTLGDPPEYPFIYADSIAFGITPQQAADQILAQKAAWVAIGSAIERIRLTGKKNITTAINTDEIKTIKEATITELNSI
jgi:hypothetical protein